MSHVASSEMERDKTQGSEVDPDMIHTSSVVKGKPRSMSTLSGMSNIDVRHAFDGPSPHSSRAVDVLVAEDNPISQKILETLLIRMGCRCVCVNDGAEALGVLMGDMREYRSLIHGSISD